MKKENKDAAHLILGYLENIKTTEKLKGEKITGSSTWGRAPAPEEALVPLCRANCQQ
jgi:hypothetical protein